MKVVYNCILLLFILSATSYSQDKILNHKVLIDEQGILSPWTSYDNIIDWSIGFIKNCPTKKTNFCNDPLYLLTAKLNPDGTYIKSKITRVVMYIGLLKLIVNTMLILGIDNHWNRSVN